MRTRAPKWLYAFIVSFVVYLSPIIGPHTMSFMGEVWRELWHGERERLWIAADIGFAVFLQLVTFGALYWLFRKPGKLRIVAVLAAVPVVMIAAEYAYLVYIPSQFLIEQDTAAETGTWPIECAASDVSLIDVPHPARSLIWSELPVQSPDGSYKIVRIPGCELAPLPVPQARVQPGGRVDFVTALTYFVPHEGVIFSKQETATGAFTWNHLVHDRITPIPGLHSSAAPILSLDGQWVAWLEKKSLAIERIDGQEAPLQIDLGNLDTFAYTLRTVDMQQGEIELARSDRQLVLALNGSIKASNDPPLVWDVYRDDGPYRVSWNFGGNSGTHKVLKGRSINSAAMSPSGDLIAVSVATALNIGHIRDSIYVLRAKDGAEVFRRYLPTYTRTPVLFPTDDLLVYTADGKVLVLRVPR